MGCGWPQCCDRLRFNFSLSARPALTGPAGFLFLKDSPMTIPKLDYTKLDGLVSAVIQDWKSGRVLMVGYMNEEAFAKTLETGKACFYSRSRNKLWIKGESSGHFLEVKEVRTDCDLDTVLLQVEAIGPGVCHEGYESCFAKKLNGGNEFEYVDTPAYDPKAVYGK
jgi:phosphoribosyl-AMP cyclohydrolase